MKYQKPTLTKLKLPPIKHRQRLYKLWRQCWGWYAYCAREHAKQYLRYNGCI